MTVVRVILLVVCCAALSCAAAQAEPNVPAGFVSLFNGEDLTGWKGLVSDPPGRAKMTGEQLAAAQKKADELMRKNWKVTDGSLIYTGNGYDNLCTANDYGDFELLVDWKIDAASDSGIYLRGSPQVQIWDPNNWRGPSPGGRAATGSGGLFNNKNNPSKPLTVADRPVGQWNTFRIIMAGSKVTVYLNGVLVVDNVELESYWEPGKPIYPKGAIELQAHKTRVWFRNIFIREIHNK